MQLDLLILKFEGTYTAGRALSEVRAADPSLGWLAEVGVVERHNSGRVSMAGTYSGYYGEANEGDEVAAGVALGSLTGGLIGLIGGPAGFVIGLVGGGALGAGIGKAVEDDSSQEVYDRIKEVLPKGSSALILLAATPTIDEMTAAFKAYNAARILESLSDDEVAELERQAAA